MDNQRNFFDKRIIIGFVFIIIGALVFLQNMGLISFKLYSILLSWQTLLILIGLLNIAHQKNKTFGSVLVFIGVGFMIPKILGINYEFSHVFWPVVFVTIGVLILFKKQTHKNFEEFHARMHMKFNEKCKDSSFSCCDDKWSKEEYNNPDYINEFNFFSGSERRITCKTFRGGSVTNIFGGANYDLCSAELVDGESVLDVTNVFGGMKIVAPSDWNIQIDVVSIFGGFVDKRRSISDNSYNMSKTLRISGTCLFGGGEIR